MPAVVSSEYFNWPKLPDIFPASFPGVKTSRDDVVIDIDKERLIKRMEQYFDPIISHEEMKRISPGSMEKVAGYDPISTREKLCKRGFLSQNIVRYCYRPFDVRWLYWEPETKFLDRNRPEYFPQIFHGNVWIEARQKQPMEKFDRGYVTTALADNFGNGLSSYFPLQLSPEQNQLNLFVGVGPRPNLSETANIYLASIKAVPPRVFYHSIAILHTPVYRQENAGALRQDWPRIPFPATEEAVAKSAMLGVQLSLLLDTERDVDSVTKNPLRPELQAIGLISSVDKRTLNAATGDLAVTASWGHGGGGNPIMPGRGKAIEREYTPAEMAAIESGAEALGLMRESALALLGETTYDVYLNDVAYWRNIPARVWDYTIGGYQVIKKWLSYRERGVLGRDLTADEAREVMQMARRIAAILLLEPQLDANYRAIVADTYTWPR